MSIRSAVLPDARRIAEIHVAAWGSAYRGLLPDDVLDNLSVATSQKRWTERITRPWGHVLVALQVDEVVGFAACGESKDEDVDWKKTGEIYVIYVHPHAWRQGHGTALAGEAIQRLREDGFEEAILWVLEGNQRAIEFYEAAGFAADGASRVKQRADGSEMPIVRFRRNIG